MRVCTHCKEEKNESEFYKDKTKPDGLRQQCKPCTKIKKKKKCSGCNTTKPMSEFYASSSRCKECEKERSKKRNKGNQPITIEDLDIVSECLIGVRTNSTGMKVCQTCNTDLPIEAYATDCKTTDGYRDSCEKCLAIGEEEDELIRGILQDKQDIQMRILALLKQGI